MWQIWYPWENLGCFGLRLGRGMGWFYADVFVRPYLGIFCRIGRRRWYINVLRLRVRESL